MSGTVLIVDDEEIVRESLSGWLEKDGYTVATAPDGPTALARLANETWSILLVDMKMPGMDGLQVLAEGLVLRPRELRWEEHRVDLRSTGAGWTGGGTDPPSEGMQQTEDSAERINRP